MVPHRQQSGGSSRVVSPSVDIMKNTSSRLPTRAANSSAMTPADPSLPSKLVKKRASTRRPSDIPAMESRSPPAGNVRHLAGKELRRELEQSAMPSHTRYTNAISSPAGPRVRGASRTPVSVAASTPSLFSGSSASTQESPKSNRLRRKQSNIVGQSPHALRDDAGPRYKDPYDDAILGIAMPTVPSAYNSREVPDDVIHLDQYVFTHPDLRATELRDPAPLYALSISTPSTSYSPGPFSISSTPTSMSSASPGYITSPASRTKQPSPSRTRPPASRPFVDVTGTNPKSRGLAPVRESSSSSTSTLRGGESSRSKSKPRVNPMPTLAPSPPPQPLSATHHRRVTSSTKSLHNGYLVTETGDVLPEFAHLVDSSPRRGSLNAAAPPRRPSRDGAPEIFVQQKSPVVHSNMNSLPNSTHRRQSSFEAKRSIPALTVDTTRSRFGIPRASTVSPSPSQGSALSPRTAAPVTRGFTPDYPSENEGSARIRPSPTLESRSFARFGFFSKKNKINASTAAATQEKKSRKGPVAGTGHEGYGRFAFRGRSGSTTSSTGTTNVGRSPSTDSAIGTLPPRSRKSSIGSKNGSSSDFEEFLAEREKPIAIRGGQSITRPATERSQTEALRMTVGQTRNAEIAVPSWNSSETSLDPPKRPILLPSPMSEPLLTGSPMKREPKVKAQKEEKSSLASFSSLTSRRTSRRSFLGGNALAAVQKAESGPATQGWKGSGASDSAAKVGDSHVSVKPPSRWNFLQRSKSPGRQPTPAPFTEPALSARPQRSVAHYAMVAGAPKTLDANELEKIIQEAEGSTPEDASNSETEQKLRARNKGKANIRHGHSVLLPEPPKLPPVHTHKRSASPKVTLQPPPQSALPLKPQPDLPKSPQAISIVGQHRPSRLPQVGRIPRVISKRDRERKLPDVSFSRPFQATQPSPALRYGPLSPSISSSESVQASFVALPDLAMASAAKGLQTSPDVLSSSPPHSPSTGFMSHTQRKDSEQSSRSSCSAYFNVLATTAMIPAPDAPFSDDEVWDEYDDLEDMFTGKSQKAPKTPMTGSSLGAPFQYAEFSPKDEAIVHRPSTAPNESVADAQSEVPKVPTLASIAHQIRVPSMRDFRITSYLPSAGTPNSPFRMSAFVGSYGERNLSTIEPISGRLSLMPSSSRLSSSTNGRYSLPATIRPQSSQQGPLLPATRHTPSKSESSSRDSRVMERAETEYMGFDNLANLRFGALMTSKWLSFGRVLFSPAHSELNTRGENRVLVLDGLGKDWSFYVALNYPNTTVYNLGTEPTETIDHTPSSPIQSLPNHRHIHHPSLRDPFPFPKGFFAAVVFRFPVATTESAYKSAIFECKRVLCPGGYLEISALDMDMMNMGSRARAALRGLKTKIQSEDSSVSLKPLSDNFQKLLYRRGFENLNRCVVGIPCAGRIPGSRDEGNTPEPHSASVESSTGSSKRMDDDMPSFGDLFLSKGQAGDEGVTKMVSKVGRWWYSRCYESLVLPDGNLNKSIWNDDALIRECEKRSTNLRLMICYAQKPECPVRRTISV